jgi:hypothetical protein
MDICSLTLRDLGASCLRCFCIASVRPARPEEAGSCVTVSRFVDEARLGTQATRTKENRVCSRRVIPPCQADCRVSVCNVRFHQPACPSPRKVTFLRFLAAFLRKGCMHRVAASPRPAADYTDTAEPSVLHSTFSADGISLSRGLRSDAGKTSVPPINLLLRPAWLWHLCNAFPCLPCRLVALRALDMCHYRRRALSCLQPIDPLAPTYCQHRFSRVKETYRRCGHEIQRVRHAAIVACVVGGVRPDAFALFLR